MEALKLFLLGAGGTAVGLTIIVIFWRIRNGRWF